MGKVSKPLAVWCRRLHVLFLLRVTRILQTKRSSFDRSIAAVVEWMNHVPPQKAKER